MKLSRLYEDDEYQWVLTHIDKLRNRQRIDRKNLALFLEDYARSELNAVESRLEIIIAHLLKNTYQPTKKSRSWMATIIRERHRVQSDLAVKSLYNKVIQSLPRVYKKARKLAAAETGLSVDTFPIDLNLTLGQILEDDRYGI